MLLNLTQAQTITRNWERRWAQAANSIDEPLKVAASGNEAVYVCGKTRIPGSVDKSVLLKYDGAGNLLWTSIYPGVAGQTDELNQLVVDEDGNVFVGGIAGSLTGQDAIVLKYAPSGVLDWEARFPLSGLAPYFPVIAVGSDRMPLLSYASNGDMQLAKLSAQGAVVWHRSFDAPTHGIDIPSDLAVDAFGNVVQTGVCQSDPNQSFKHATFTLKYSLAGDLLWTQVENGFIDNVVSFPVLTTHGGIPIVAADPESTFGLPVTLTYPIDDSGHEIWRQRWPDNNQADAAPIRVRTDSRGNVYVATQQVSPSDLTVVKYRVDGTRAWVTNVDIGGFDNTVDMTLDSRANTWLLGQNGMSSIGAGLAAVSASGLVLGKATYKGESTGNTLPISVAVDPLGRAYIACAVYPGGDVALLQYKAFLLPVPGGPGHRINPR